MDAGQLQEMFASMMKENKEQKKQINNLLDVMSKVPKVGSSIKSFDGILIYLSYQ